MNSIANITEQIARCFAVPPAYLAPRQEPRTPIEAARERLAYAEMLGVEPDHDAQMVQAADKARLWGNHELAGWLLSAVRWPPTQSPTSKEENKR